LPSVAGLDLARYAQDVLARFRNPGIVHRLDQIAGDGSQKLPYRLGDTLAANLRRGTAPACIVGAFGCWIAFLMRRSRMKVPIVDPAATALAGAAREGTPAEVIARIAPLVVGLPVALASSPALEQATEAAWTGDWDRLFGSCA
jgi:fructuronate reductase